GGMAEAVAIAGLEHGDARLHGGEKGRARRGLAAVMGRDQDVAAQGGTADDERGLLLALDVAGEERAAPAARDAQHARHRVRPQRARVVVEERLQDLELDAVPLPALAGDAALPAAGEIEQRV